MNAFEERLVAVIELSDVRSIAAILSDIFKLVAKSPFEGVQFEQLVDQITVFMVEAQTKIHHEITLTHEGTALTVFLVKEFDRLLLMPDDTSYLQFGDVWMNEWFTDDWHTIQRWFSTSVAMQAVQVNKILHSS